MPTFENTETYQKNNKESGLIYGDLTLEDLVTKDADGDKVPDWQEGLFGLDPTKKETTPGTPDSVAIEKLKDTKADLAGTIEKINSDTENLTATERFSRELFATIVSASQNGAVNEASIEKLTSSLAEKVQNSPPRKVFSIFDVKVVNNDTVQAFKNYNDALNSIYTKNSGINYTVLDVLQEFIVDEDNVDASVLAKLDPIIKNMNKVMEELIKTRVPQSISDLHLKVINSHERIIENLSDIRLYDSDPIMTLGGISNYQKNVNQLESSLGNLFTAVSQKLSQ
ncbi:hypothetical protein A2641_01475 [Candidatus Nomurabacteria bacterium RIFCSPHIGHO2_01_FULL_37_25]|uniref:Uncharacterized protein n=1 Tax=Candidatus Nomurabacteria bacterium RIFCSPLOWO2_01_FULL_36_16 TaxID=1801767 RepID=A0A1F6WZ25_9BACT|nr:MAG: hypothetical protein A2641_01475 [Candidatus Nomurabacteria bacterium RIFCSPHIGHO2_01_FULL_37_25]OGI75381.1 MAG: hypothetical protein A3D36_02375 [Candidatus Nomurabacteria bacterium RIFCSPHIGHO2_02_FULL_36_29]OGI87128.1 MAG: hypothetical protein A3A91_00470 [Candidatus Nomurabacteria bacterium RIFCSPLOWO2_01_FULL_36_16]OGI97307.1 MAG: hypothetical protein A3I84_00885 [Candidatus Nomurabacteria bacterium RIFCSPLOWO2_02_FULL_36_8]